MYGNGMRVWVALCAVWVLVNGASGGVTVFPSGTAPPHEYTTPKIPFTVSIDTGSCGSTTITAPQVRVSAAAFLTDIVEDAAVSSLTQITVTVADSELDARVNVTILAGATICGGSPSPSASASALYVAPAASSPPPPSSFTDTVPLWAIIVGGSVVLCCGCCVALVFKKGHHGHSHGHGHGPSVAPQGYDPETGHEDDDRAGAVALVGSGGSVSSSKMPAYAVAKRSGGVLNESDMSLRNTNDSMGYIGGAGDTVLVSPRVAELGAGAATSPRSTKPLARSESLPWPKHSRVLSDPNSMGRAAGAGAGAGAAGGSVTHREGREGRHGGGGGGGGGGRRNRDRSGSKPRRQLSKRSSSRMRAILTLSEQELTHDEGSSPGAKSKSPPRSRTHRSLNRSYTRTFGALNASGTS